MKFDFKTLLKIAFVIFGLYLAILYWPIATQFMGLLWAASLPLILGAIIAYLLNILMAFYQRIYPNVQNKILVKGKNIFCLLFSLISIVAVIVLVFALVIPELVACGKMLMADLPKAIDDFMRYLEINHILPTYLEELILSVDWEKELLAILSTISSSLGNVMGSVVSVVSSFVGGISTGFLSFIFAIYLLLSKDNLKRQINRLFHHFLKEKTIKRLYYIFETLDECFHRFTVGQCTEALILGGLCFLGMSILGLPYATMIGALVGFTSLIPIVGAFIGASVGVFLIIMESLTQAIIFLVFIIVLQQLEGDFIYPKVVGSSIGLPGIWVFAAVIIGGGMFGILGMLVAVPLFAFIYRLIKDELDEKGFFQIQ